MDCDPTFIEKYAPLIVGGLAFSAVMISLAFNAWLSRLEHKREIRHQRKRTRIGILAELRLNCAAVERAAAHQAGAEPADFWAPTKVMDDVYQSALDRIVELTPDEIYMVVEAYTTLRVDKEKLSLLGNPTGGYGKYILISAENVPTYIAQQENVLVPIKAAIKSLEAAIRPPAG